jgi:triose/dihydroxyacetone kinase / FAD-AMP lyase (cyclizing)
LEGQTNGTVRHTSQTGPKIDPTLIQSTLQSACDAAIKAEPDITKWDVQMGDGDCGEAVESMCKGVLKKLDAGLTKDGDLFHILDEVESAVEEVGGTLGAIISIVLASFTSNLRLAYAKAGEKFGVDIHSASKAAGQALKNLMGYTSARQGGRTVMDTLIPFCETLEKDVNFSKAVEAAEKGADSTRGMKAKFGRGEC